MTGLTARKKSRLWRFFSYGGAKPSSAHLPASRHIFPPAGKRKFMEIMPLALEMRVYDVIMPGACQALQ
jgi:hypothetical protein